jgi:hypothetical protein
MTDGEAPFQAGQGEPSLPFRPRGAYIGYQVFGDGDSAVLVDPEVARDLRSAGESARQERRIAAGLLYGRGWTDDEGDYLVVDGFLEAGPGENPRDHMGDAEFTLSEADLRLLRRDAERMYSAAVEVGWWRSQMAGGDFDAADYRTQAELVPPGGVGLLVYETGPDWGAAYLDPDGHAPEPAVRYVPVPSSALAPGVTTTPQPEPGSPLSPELTASPEQAPVLEDAPALEDEPVPAGPVQAAGAGGAPWPGPPRLTPPPEPAGPRVQSPTRVPRQELGRQGVNPYPVGPKTPTDVKIVVGLAFIAMVIVAIIIGVLFKSAVIALILALILLVLVAGFIRISRG